MTTLPEDLSKTNIVYIESQELYNPPFNVEEMALKFIIEIQEDKALRKKYIQDHGISVWFSENFFRAIKYQLNKQDLVFNRLTSISEINTKDNLIIAIFANGNVLVDVIYCTVVEIHKNKMMYLPFITDLSIPKELELNSNMTILKIF